MPDRPLTGPRILALVAEVADELPEGQPRRSILIVGGSLLAWHNLRDSTADVDSLLRLDPELREAVRRVAGRHGLAPGWLNDSAAGWRPQTLDISACELLMDHPRLLVLGAPYRDLFLMKLLAARAVDHDDLVRLWPLSGFASPVEAASEMQRAFPAEPEDRFLAEYIASIAQESTGST